MVGHKSSVNSGAWSRTDALGNFESGNDGYAFTFTPHDDYSSNQGAILSSSAIDLSSMTNMTLSKS